ncbi:Cytochrome c oxidase assembly protein cox15, partial [Coemansia sp. RSA 2703]
MSLASTLLKRALSHVRPLAQSSFTRLLTTRSRPPVLRQAALIGRTHFLRASMGISVPNRASSSILRQIPTNAFARTYSSSTLKAPRRTVDAPIVGYWTLFCASMVFGIIVWGGLTRLTESGLSIVEWAPITGAKLPTSDAQWESEFEKYKQFPEYHKVHIGITLDDFKKIYFMEWFHRNIGRLFGVIYL